jgi:tetratricopeptide (TPR) repeat protein
VTETINDLIARGYKASREDRLADSRAAFIEAIRKAAIEADQLSLAEALCGLAQAERGIGNPVAAGHHYANAALLYRELGLRERLAYAIRHEADIFRETGKVVEAEPLYVEAEEIYRELGEKATLDLANTLRGLALVNESTAKLDLSKSFWQEARELYAKCSVDAGVAECDQKLSH